MGRIAEFLGLSAEGGRVRLHTVAVMRWVAVVGQLFTVLFVHFSLGVRLPLVALLPAILLTAAINLALTSTYRAPTRLSERAAALLFAYDVLQLCWLLGLTGGLQNPFALLLLLPVTLAAATLGLVPTTLLTVLALLGTTVLALVPGPLPWTGEGALNFPPLFLLAVWTALCMALILVSIFAWNIAEEARRHADALAAIQLALSREQKMSALGAQAAAAAHLLGSPLATINVIAKEFVNELPPDHPLAEEARDLLTQAQRSREIMATLGKRPEDTESGIVRAPFSALLSHIAEEFARPGIAVQVTVVASDEATEPELYLPPELRHALANLIDNAIQFAAREVSITLEPSRAELLLRIQDDGPGFSPEVMEWLGEPYLSTRHGNGGLGLGVFIAITLLARTGAKVHFDNHGRGARVTIVWPAQAVQRAVEDQGHERRAS